MFGFSGFGAATAATGAANPVFPRLVAAGSKLPQPGTVLVTAERVGKVFRAPDGRVVAAVAGVDLRLRLGRAYLIRGPSGSGKTTLLSILGCMVRPTEGRVRIAGRETTRLPEDDLAELRRAMFGFVFQHNQLVRGFSALRNVMVPVLPRAGLNGLERRARSLLSEFGLADRADMPVERLSGGEQQRVAIARALINRPLVIVADEPTAHLDADTASVFLDLVDDFRREGKLVVVASHDPALTASGRFDRVVELRNGRTAGAVD